MPTVTSSELELLIQFRHGSPKSRDAAFEILFHQHQRAVYGWILRIVRDRGAAEELTLETFWRIYRARARFEPERGLESWERRIATRAALDWLRSRRTEAAVRVDFPAEVAAREQGDAAVTAEIRQRTAKAFGRLKPGLRVAATLAILEELPHREIAEAMGISVAAVKLRVFRALHQLRKDLRKQGITP